MGEVALADEVWDDVDLWGIDHEEGFAHGGLFFPEADVDFGKEVPPADFCGVIEVGCGGVWIFRGSMADDEECGMRLWCEGHAGKVTHEKWIASEGVKVDGGGGFREVLGSGDK